MGATSSPVAEASGPATPAPDRPEPDPSSVLTISPRGSVAVATTELFEHAGVHEGVAALADELAFELARADALVAEAALLAADTHHGMLAEQAIDEARRELEHTAATCRGLTGALRTAAGAYGAAEQAAESGWAWITSAIGHTLGAAARLTMPAWLPTVALGALAALGGKAALEGLGLDDEVAALWAGVGVGANGVITDPGVVSALRTIAMGADDFASGFAGIPLPLQFALGDTGLGLLGLSTAAGLLRMTGNETPPTVRPTVTQPVAAPPSSMVDLGSRIPHTDENGGAQITVEQYTMPDGSTRVVVLLAGTADFTIGTDEPWDMGGNFSAVAGMHSSATMAVDEALRQAGVDATTPIQLVGFSQGGAQAAVVAMSGQYAVDSVVTFGAPVGQLPIPESIPVLAVRHPDDLVASGAGGDELHLPNVFEVRNTAFAGQPVPTDQPAPAHQWDSYERTAALMDADGSPELRAAIDEVLAFTAGAEHGTSTSYLAVRTDG